MLQQLSATTGDALRTALSRAGYTTDGVRDLFGPGARAALGRGEVEPAFRAAADGARQDRDRVTGVGAASLTLAAATVRRPVRSLLDLGTGCGVQALHPTRHTHAVTGTDIAPRALAMARATFALDDLSVELVEGPCTEPLAGRHSDQIVSNPPIVPGPARADDVYRDSGEDGDAAPAALIADLPSHLEPGGVAQLLGSWRHVRGEDWPDRVRSRLPAGVAAWIIQRGVVDPDLHVDTWQRDAGLDLASPDVRARAAACLDWMDGARVEAVGSGTPTRRKLDEGRTDGPANVVFEDPPGAADDPLGPEVEGWLDRIDRLRAHASGETLLDARPTVAPSVVLERFAEAGAEGWTEAGAAVARTDGPRWRHEAFAHDRPLDELVAANLPAVRESVHHGLLPPPL